MLSIWKMGPSKNLPMCKCSSSSNLPSQIRSKATVRRWVRIHLHHPSGWLWKVIWKNFQFLDANKRLVSGWAQHQEDISSTDANSNSFSTLTPGIWVEDQAGDILFFYSSIWISEQLSQSPEGTDLSNCITTFIRHTPFSECIWVSMCPWAPTTNTLSGAKEEREGLERQGMVLLS